jgi:hypothetical protein
MVFVGVLRQGNVTEQAMCWKKHLAESCSSDQLAMVRCRAAIDRQ